MKKNILILVLIIIVNTYNITNHQCYAIKTTKEQIKGIDIFMKDFGKTYKLDNKDEIANIVFCRFFEEFAINRGNTAATIEGVSIIHFEHKNGISDKEYLTIFGYNKGDISNKEYTSRVVLIDSICAYYGIKIEDLIDIRKSKHLINKKKKEINELFVTNLKKLEDKFNRDKMIETITEKVLQKQNESSMPTIPDTVPDCPPLI